jgi:hypothetical protein
MITDIIDGFLRYFTVLDDGGLDLHESEERHTPAF